MDSVTAPLVLQVSANNRTVLRVVLAELSDRMAEEIVIRRGRVTEQESWVEVELRAGCEELEAAMLLLSHPRVSVRTRRLRGPDGAREAKHARLTAIAR